MFHLKCAGISIARMAPAHRLNLISGLRRNAQESPYLLAVSFVKADSIPPLQPGSATLHPAAIPEISHLE
jgi:hypothetical protein